MKAAASCTVICRISFCVSFVSERLCVDMYYYRFLTMLLGLFLTNKLVQGKDPTKKDAISMRMTSVLSPRSNESWTISATANGNDLTPGTPWINEDSCGRADKMLTGLFPRIVGGSATVKGELPWMAMLLRYFTKNHQFIFLCGGSLIRKQWVLTAGHCFTSQPTSYTHVALGAHRKDLKDPSVKRFAIAKYVCHHLFLGPFNAFEDDICLVKLAGEVEYNEYIKPICLPTEKQVIKSGESCRIAGWGETKDTGDNTVLQKAVVNVIEKSVCSSWYRDASVTLPDFHFCAGHAGGAIDSCQGDSGGPLTCSRTVSKTTSNVLFGITSFGIGCGLKQRPGVYTEVSNYIGWIEKQIDTYSGPESCFSESDLLKCGTTITKCGTKLRTPVDDKTTWLYPPNTDCSWNIKAPTGCKIKLTFECFFHVEMNPSDSNECYDYMQIVSEEAGIDSIFCGSDLLNPFTIKGSEATIHFNSDDSIQSSGFVIKIDFVPNRVANPKSGQPSTDIPSKPKVNDRQAETTSASNFEITDVTTQMYNNAETTRSQTVAECTGYSATTTSDSPLTKPSILPILGSSLLVFKIV